MTQAMAFKRSEPKVADLVIIQNKQTIFAKPPIILDENQNCCWHNQNFCVYCPHLLIFSDKKSKSGKIYKMQSGLLEITADNMFRRTEQAVDLLKDAFDPEEPGVAYLVSYKSETVLSGGIGKLVDDMMIMLTGSQ